MTVSEGFVEIDGARLHYEEAGSGLPLVLLHGFSLDLHSWDEQFESLARHYRTIRYDLRGFGGSSQPKEGQPYSHVNDLRALTGWLGIENPVLAGFSMGGSVAIDFALACPGSVRALILVDSTLNGYRWSDSASSLYRAVIRRARESGVEAARRLWQRDPMFETAMDAPEVASRFTQMVASYSGWHWLYRDPHIALDPLAADRLAEIPVPTLLIVGERDVPDMHAMASALEAGIPGSRKFIIPGAGHLSNIESPDSVTDLVLDFLRNL